MITYRSVTVVQGGITPPVEAGENAEDLKRTFLVIVFEKRGHV